MKPTRILVTGLNGVVGWSVFQAARECSEAFGTYRKEHSLFSDARFTRVDWEDEGEILALFEKVRPDYLIHCWAICDLDLCEEIPAMAERINIRCLERLIEVLKKVSGLRKFVYMSTDHVFGGHEGNYTEDDAPEPIHVYGRTKVEAEKKVMQAGLPYMIIRPGLVIGPSLQGNIGPRDFLFSRIRADKPTHYFTDEWRSPICSKQFGKRVLDLAVSDLEGIYHVAGEKKMNRFELAHSLAAEEGLPTHQIFPKLRKEDQLAHIRPHDLSLGTKR